MAHAKITTVDGISLEVEGTPEEVSAVVQQLRRKAQQPEVLPRRGGIRKAKGRPQIPDLIELLKDEEFFRQPKGLGETQKKLGEMGHHYPVTTLSGAMQAEVKKRNLRRFKQDGKYVYVQ